MDNRIDTLQGIPNIRRVGKVASHPFDYPWATEIPVRFVAGSLEDPELMPASKQAIDNGRPQKSCTAKNYQFATHQLPAPILFPCLRA
jgi:hypothetical protein